MMIRKDLSLTDINLIRSQFPALHQEVNGYPLAYLDNAATTQKPQMVIDAITNYYSKDNSNIHRSAHTLANRATEQYEAARKGIATFINAKHEHELIFTRGTTESVNLVANAWAAKFLQAGDEVIISALEHHSNLVPWQIIAKKRKAVLKVIPLNEAGEIQMDMYHKQLSPKTKLVAIAHISNALGTINPIEEIISSAHLFGAKVFIDGAQALAHEKIDVQKLDCDFYAFSGHKAFGPTGIGALYGKEEILNEMDPFLYGGEMIRDVSFEDTTFNELPYKFEAGTPHIAGAIAFGEAIRFMEQTGIEKIAAMEHSLLEYATDKLLSIEGLRIIGRAKHKSAVVSFLIDSIHPYDVGVLLDQQGIAIRTGHHCCQPLMKSLGIEGTCRASFAFYNTYEEIDRLHKGLLRASKMLA